MKHLVLFLFFFLQLSMVNGQAIVFSLVTDKPTVAVGDTLTVKVAVRNFTRMFTMQYAVKWDKMNYRFISDQVEALPVTNGSYGSHYDSTVSALRLLWYYPNGTSSTTLPDTNIIRIKLKALQAGVPNNICFSPDDLVTEVTQLDATNQPRVLTEAIFKGINCSFNFTETASGLKTIRVTTATNDPNLTTISAKVYPNPFQSALTVAFEKPITGNVDITLYDVLGKMIFKQQKAANPLIILHLSHLPSGFYSYSIRTNEGKSIGKLVKE